MLIIYSTFSAQDVHDYILKKKKNGLHNISLAAGSDHFSRPYIWVDFSYGYLKLTISFSY